MFLISNILLIFFLFSLGWQYFTCALVRTHEKNQGFLIEENAGNDSTFCRVDNM